MWLHFQWSPTTSLSERLKEFLNSAYNVFCLLFFEGIVERQSDNAITESVGIWQHPAIMLIGKIGTGMKRKVMKQRTDATLFEKFDQVIPRLSGFHNDIKNVAINGGIVRNNRSFQKVLLFKRLKQFVIIPPNLFTPVLYFIKPDNLSI